MQTQIGDKYWLLRQLTWRTSDVDVFIPRNTHTTRARPWPGSCGGSRELATQRPVLVPGSQHILDGMDVHVPRTAATGGPGWGSLSASPAHCPGWMLVGDPVNYRTGDRVVRCYDDGTPGYHWCLAPEDPKSGYYWYPDTPLWRTLWRHDYA